MLQNGKLQYYTHCSQLNTQLYIEFLQNGSKCEVKYVGGDNVICLWAYQTDWKNGPVYKS